MGTVGCARETGSVRERERQIRTITGFQNAPLEGAAASKAQPGCGEGPGSQGLEMPPGKPQPGGGLSQDGKGGIPHRGTGPCRDTNPRPTGEIGRFALGVSQLSFPGT